MVDTSERLCQLISFMGEQTPTKKAKPAGVMGADIWVQLEVALSPDESELAFLALYFNEHCLVQYTGAKSCQKTDSCLAGAASGMTKLPAVKSPAQRSLEDTVENLCARLQRQASSAGPGTSESAYTKQNKLMAGTLHLNGSPAMRSGT
jgi:hypothetical protein